VAYCERLTVTKAVPQHAMEVLGGRGSSYSFLALALDGDEWSVSCLGCTLPPGIGLLVPFGLEAGWALQPIWTQRVEEKSFAFAGD
jgi:hypothetical protein